MIELPPALERGVAHPRLLRLGQPQRQGDLPALHGLVRRQPGAPVAAPARSRRPSGTSSSWAAPTPVVDKARALVRRRRPALGRRRCSTTWSSPSPTTPRRRRCSPTCSSSSATAPRTAPGATSTSPAPLELRSGNFGTPTVTASRRHHRPAHPGAALRRPRHPGRRPAGLGPRPRHRLVAPRPRHGYRTTLHNGVLTYVKNSDKPVGLTLTVPAAALARWPEATSRLPARRAEGRRRREHSYPRCSASCSPATRTSTSSYRDDLMSGHRRRERSTR